MIHTFEKPATNITELLFVILTFLSFVFTTLITITGIRLLLFILNYSIISHKTDKDIVYAYINRPIFLWDSDTDRYRFIYRNWVRLNRGSKSILSKIEICTYSDIDVINNIHLFKTS